jgi:hypothetical protein
MTQLITNPNVVSQEKAFEILQGLIAKPDTDAAAIPGILQNILNTLNAAFAPPVVEAPPVVKKKRRRTMINGVPVKPLGWPAGVGRAEFAQWKLTAIAAGQTENLNPHTYKALRDTGALNVTPPAAPAAPPAPPVAQTVITPPAAKVEPVAAPATKTVAAAPAAKPVAKVATTQAAPVGAGRKK